MDELDVLNELDLSLESDAFNQFNESISVLNSFYDQIQAAGGISRQQAEILVRDYPLELPEQYPINSFTAVPSQTNYQVALESVVATAGKMIVDLIKKAAELFVKILNWVLEFLQKKWRQFSDPERKVKKIQAIMKAEGKLPHVAENPTPTAEESEELQAASAKLAQTAASMEERFNDLLADMVNEARYFRLVQYIDMQMLGLVEWYQDKQNLFEDILRHSGVHRPGEDARQISILDTISKTHNYINDIITQARGAGVLLPEGELSNAMVFKAIYDHGKFLTSERSFEMPDFEQILRITTSGANGILSPLPLAAKDLEKQLLNAKRRAEHFKGFTADPRLDPRMQEVFRKAQGRLADEALSLQYYWATVLLVAQHRESFLSAIGNRALALLEYHKLLVEQSTDPKVQQKGKQVIADLNNDLRRI